MASTDHASDILRVTALMFRKPSVSNEDFYNYWINQHAEDVESLHKRYGVLEYRQYHTSPETKSFLAEAAKAMGKECLACDGMAETFIRKEDFGKYLTMQMDPEYVEKVLPGVLEYMDAAKTEFTVGVEHIVMSREPLTGVKN